MEAIEQRIAETRNKCLAMAIEIQETPNCNFTQVRMKILETLQNQLETLERIKIQKQNIY